MSAKTYDKQTAKFLAVVSENMPEVSGDVMQGWIQNPRALQEFLRGLCPSDAGIISANKSAIISIDRNQPFNPEKFLGKGWTIDEQDERSLALTEVDLSKVLLEHMLEQSETRIKGGEKLSRLKQAGYVRLDVKIFQIFWENQSLIPENWKKMTNGKTTFIFFDGTVLWRPHGYRYVLCLYWHDSRWYWRYHWLERDWRISFPSAVLANI